LARDIERYLADEPVEACPPGTGYPLRKFVRKYRGPVIAAAVVLVVLVGGAAATAWQAVRATVAERDAVANPGAATAAKAGGDRARGGAGGARAGGGTPLGALAYSADGSGGAAAVGGWPVKAGAPGGRCLPAGCESPGPITVWDARTGETVVKLPGDRRFTLC